ncbi:tRNA 2-thiouridine synthesizing protein A [Halospina denitrificans]|uniref:tRNA 2-thiouridine synthesizing protein A n=1 Tax=Halospina denitrificans TaxID=332522 RepID=A0A4R7JWX8_9GAMM|nr:sulfurtransferase TusA family protein [Halospina denitrificans]TDT42960.1 tRNA 2-thiouridine synthesizing protein A [Halospina denitrificans]
MSAEADQTLDASGLQCPMPLLKTKLCLNGMEPGESLRVIATDPGSARDIPAFLRLSDHELEVEEHDEDRYVFVIRRGQDKSGTRHG